MIRPARRPSIEALEGRPLMSYGGSPYLAYGTAGVASVSFGVGATSVESSAVQADGKTVVVGGLTSATATNPVVLIKSASIARFNLDGSLDNSFGSGGVLNLFVNNDNTTVTRASSVAVQPNGKLVVAVTQAGKAEVVRLNLDGSLDPSFGDQGVASLPTTSSSGATISPFIQGVAIAPDGGIVASEIIDTGNAQGEAFALVKLNADGSDDTSFGYKGSANTAFMTVILNEIPLTTSGLVIQPDGKIDFAGTEIDDGNPAGSIGVEQFNANGSSDLSFGVGSSTELPNPNRGVAYTGVATSLALEPNGQVVLGGYATVTSTGVNQFLVARLLPNGMPDPGFGYSGVVLFGQPTSNILANPFGDTVTVAPDGKILIGGSRAGAAVARLDSDGTADQSFGQGGVALVTAPSNTSSSIVGVSVRPDGVILATTSNGQVLSLRNTGAADDYNDDGVSDPSVYLPNQAVFAYRPSGGAPDVVVPFGAVGAGQTIPAPGDYDGSGESELGVYLPTQGSFAYRPAGGGADVVIPFGIPGAGQTIPAVGYYDGSGVENVAAYLPSLGVYAIRPTRLDPSTVAIDELVPFGIAGPGQSIPVPGNYEGTGIDDIAVYLPSIGAYAIRPSTGGPDKIIPFGLAGMGQSIPMPGDYDGSGLTELAVYLPKLGEFAYRPANGGPDVVVPFGIAGAGQTLPMAGDYTGVGHDELGVYLPSLGVFAYRPGLPASPTGVDVVEPFGPAGVGQTIPFNGVPASNTLPTTVAAASVSAESTSWFDVLPSATRPKKSANDQGTADVPVVG